MRTTLEMVQEFHRKFVKEPGIPLEKIKAVRPVLLREELKELEEARNPIAILDALSDTQYVLDGTFLAYDFGKPEIGVGWYLNHKYRPGRLKALVSIFEAKAAFEDIPGMMASLHELQWRLDEAYYYFGFANAKQAAFEEVHRSNMAKLGPDGKPIIRADGKILKPEGWKPPNLQQFLLD